MTTDNGKMGTCFVVGFQRVKPTFVINCEINVKSKLINIFKRRLFGSSGEFFSLIWTDR